MKKTYILFLILFCFSIHGQKMVSKTAEWRYMHEEFDVSTTSWHIKSLHTINYQNKDSIIDGKEYLQFNRGSAKYFLYEDTVTNKVFFRFDPSSWTSTGLSINKDYLLYDFSVDIGDTVITAFHGLWYRYHIIDSVYFNALSGGDSLKTYDISIYESDTTVNTPQSFVRHTTWYEGVGSQRYIFEPMFAFYDIDFEQINNLYCFRDSIQQIQFEPFVVFNVDPNINCDFDPPISIRTYSDKSPAISLYPNPFRDILNLDFPEECKDGIYEIYDSSGKCLLKGVLRSHHNTINTGALSPGVYFFKLQTDHSIFTRKLIKS